MIVETCTAESKPYRFSIAQQHEQQDGKEDATNRVQRAMVVRWSADGEDRNPALASFAILNILEDLIGKAGTVFRMDDATFGLVLHGTRPELSDEAMERLGAFLDSCLAKYAKIGARVGIGPIMRTFLDLNSALTTALQTMNEGAVPAAEMEAVSAAVPVPCEPETHPFVEEAKQLLQQNYGDGVCLKTIAKQLFVNPAYLGRLFKTHESIPFNDYLVQVRMEKAKMLLKTTDMRIYEIAHEVGYRQLDWFYKKFKAYTGCSAKEFKAKRL